MSQNDLTIANQGFASFRSDLNSALQALGSTNSGTSAPSTTFANQLFYDTTNNILKIRNEDNDAFISLFTLDQTNDLISGFTSPITITTADNLAQLTLVSTDADASSGPQMTLYRNSSSPADADFLGRVKFLGRNDNSQDFVGVDMIARIIDASDGTEDSEFRIATIRGGTETTDFKITSSGAISAPEIVFNDDSTDIDFRIESNDSANMFYLNGGNNQVGIGLNPTSTVFHVETSTDGSGVSGDNIYIAKFYNKEATDGRSFGVDIHAGSNSSDQALRVKDHDGSNDFLVVRGDGAITKPSQPCFSATADTTNIPLVTQTTIALSGERFDVGSNLDANTFTAPISGKYLFTYMFFFTSLDADHTGLDTHIKTSNKQYQQTFSPSTFFSSDGNFSVSGSVLADMDSGDTCFFTTRVAGGSAQTDIHTDSQVSGVLIC